MSILSRGDPRQRHAAATRWAVIFYRQHSADRASLRNHAGRRDPSEPASAAASSLKLPGRRRTGLPARRRALLRQWPG
jgi:hypothetical protein